VRALRRDKRLENDDDDAERETHQETHKETPKETHQETHHDVASSSSSVSVDYTVSTTNVAYDTVHSAVDAAMTSNTFATLLSASVGVTVVPSTPSVIDISPTTQPTQAPQSSNKGGSVPFYKTTAGVASVTVIIALICLTVGCNTRAFKRRQLLRQGSFPVAGVAVEYDGQGPAPVGVASEVVVSPRQVPIDDQYVMVCNADIELPTLRETLATRRDSFKHYPVAKIVDNSSNNNGNNNGNDNDNNNENGFHSVGGGRAGIFRDDGRDSTAFGSILHGHHHYSSDENSDQQIQQRHQR
jgi:hypothetical protein